jgi:hypothetical protein
MRAATADHAQAIHVLPRNEFGGQHATPGRALDRREDGRCVEVATPKCDRPADLARVIGNVAKAQARAGGVRVLDRRRPTCWMRATRKVKAIAQRRAALTAD